MNIQPINITKTNQPIKTNFKSTYPVVHWVAETNGSYAPALSIEIVKKLQGTLVRAINALSRNADKPVASEFKTLKEYLKFCDKDFNKNQWVRSFYDRKSAKDSGFKPVAYMITGDDIARFNDELGKEVGRAKGYSKKVLGNPYSAEAKMAIETYVNNGLKFVNSKDNRFIGLDGQTYALHTKFEVQRNKSGKIKGYKFVGARFLPEKGENSPIERYANKH